MSMTLGQAFAKHAIRAHYNDEEAMVIPMTPDLHKSMGEAELAKTGKEVLPGHLLITWKDEHGQSHGGVVEASRWAELGFDIRNDAGEDIHFGRGGYPRIIQELSDAAKLHARRMAAPEAQEVAPEASYPANAFHFVPALEAMQASVARRVNDPREELSDKAEVMIFSDSLSRIASSTLTSDEYFRLEQARQYREQIGQIQPDHPEAIRPTAAVAAQDHGQGFNAGLVVRSLGIDGGEPRFDQAAAQRANPTLMREVMSVFTTTHPLETNRQVISDEGFQDYVQALAPYEDHEWGDQALARCRDLLAARMPHYELRQARLFSKDGADILMIQDPFVSTLYSWDSATRTLDPEAHLKAKAEPTLEDVPTPEALQALAATVNALNGYDHEDDYDDEPDYLSGPTPYAY